MSDKTRSIYENRGGKLWCKDSDKEPWRELSTGATIGRLTLQETELSGFKETLQLQREELAAKELELEESLAEQERLRLLIPTLAQAMVYQDLLNKFEASESSLAKLQEVAKELKSDLVFMHEKYGYTSESLATHSSLPESVKGKQ